MAEAVAREGSGKYIKTHSPGMHFGRVVLHFTPSDGGGLVVREGANVLRELEPGANPDTPGYLAWRRGAALGVKIGARLAGVASGVVEIHAVVGLHTDSNERSLAGAGALALWDAVEFSATPAVRESLDRLILDDAAPLE